ncbi:DUF2950 domain-containing protein [uncultured Reyranella sp.]|uniref:DUF2950 domain-containing protein n=1 Tax=uncultured Reyranella sp. TaxID=735512 RepID=UPI0025CE8BFE|nr:DUF2950 domain-containing protein [uncultured Reyranella sp.]
MSASMFRKALLALLVASGLAIALVTGASAQSAKPEGFATPEAAANALTDAIRRDDSKAVGAILGSGWRDIVLGRPEDEERLREKFLEAWDTSHKIVVDGNKATIEAGTTGWTGPIPIVRDGDQWRFDVEAGRKEITARRIGRNELSVIQSLLALVDAEHEYAALDPMKVGAPVYARRLLSSPGKKDGLYWDVAPGEPQSPIGPALATAQAQGQGGTEDGYYGYRFRLLYAQGPEAPGGAYDYLVKGRMIGGFAILAWPVRYDDTGVMTFMVNQDGVVYEQDLGPDTATKAAAITVYNPDKGWEKADMTPP